MPTLFLGLVVLVLLFFACPSGFLKPILSKPRGCCAILVAVRRFWLPCSYSCAVKSAQHFRLGCLVSASSAMSRSGRKLWWAHTKEHRSSVTRAHRFFLEMELESGATNSARLYRRSLLGNHTWSNTSEYKWDF